ncbi:hypothetical protein BGC07_15155 [Piscirickettsia litoralis]|uniref:Uncharacterized protein n=2 Tax=Piscirickettsia litoralis TaxID=1891921 RepID=A0ABX2ZY90_9GAMM|nr:hypothetical protein BGC07_15155 [Piscirickettsia litoralis]
MYINRQSDGHKAGDIAASRHSLYSIQKHKPDILFHPEECSAIFGRKGHLYFDFVLFDFYEQYSRNKFFSGSHAISLDQYKREGRMPYVINCMMIAQYLLTIKFGFTSEDFTFDVPNENLNSNQYLIDYKANNYKFNVPFIFMNAHFEKFYSQSHRTHSVSDNDHRPFEI